MTKKNLERFCWLFVLHTKDELLKKLHSFEVDWEFYDFIKDDFEAYLARRQEAEDIFSEIALDINKRKINSILYSEKDRAFECKALYGDLFHVAINYANNRMSYIEDWKQAYSLEMKVTPFRKMKKDARPEDFEVKRASSDDD